MHQPQKERADLDSQNKLKGLAVPGSEIAEQNYITYTGNEATGIDADAYVAKITLNEADTGI